MALRALLMLMVLVQGVAAQQTEAQAEVAVEDLPAGPAEIGLGGSHDVAFNVRLSLAGLACTQDAVVSVNLDVNDLPSPLTGIDGSPMEARMNFTIPQGNYVLQPFEARRENMLHIRVAADALPEHDHRFEVVARSEAGTPDGCFAANALPAAEDSSTHAIRTGPAPTAESPEVEAGRTEPGAPASRDTPAPLALMPLLLAALLARR